MRQFGVAVPGGVEHGSMRARTLLETSSWLVLRNCSNAFNTVGRTAVIAEATNCVPALTPLVAKCYGTRPTDVFFRMDSGKTRTIAFSSGVQQGDPMGPAMFCLGLRPGLKRFREEFELEGVEGFAYMDDLSLGLTGVTANTVRAFAFLRRVLEAIGVVVNNAKTVAFPPKGHAPTAEEISLLQSVDVRIVDEGEITVVGVPIGRDEYMLERALEIVRDGGADRLSCCFANVPDKQAAALIAIKSLGQRASPRSRQKGRQQGAVGV